VVGRRDEPSRVRRKTHTSTGEVKVRFVIKWPTKVTGKYLVGYRTHVNHPFHHFKLLTGQEHVSGGVVGLSHGVPRDHDPDYIASLSALLEVFNGVFVEPEQGWCAWILASQVRVVIFAGHPDGVVVFSFGFHASSPHLIHPAP